MDGLHNSVLQLAALPRSGCSESEAEARRMIELWPESSLFEM